MAYLEHEGPRGFGGWVVVFFVAMTVISPIRALIATYQTLYADPQIAAAYGDGWAVLEAGEWIIVALSIAGCWFIGWRLVAAYRASTKWIAIVGMWVLALAVPLLELTMVSAVSGLSMAALGAGMGAEFAQPVGFCVIWTLFFLFSKRVANTYTDEVYEEDVGEVFQ